MAEIRCPMCGRANPDEHDVCEFCGARLKPLTGGLAAANEEWSPAQSPEGEPAEGAIQAGDEPTPRSTSELEKTLPDWLRNIRQSEAEAAAQSAAELSDQGEQAEDDFFRRMAELNAEGEPAESVPEPAPAEDDLLSRLSGLDTEPGSAAEDQPAESAEEEPGEALAPLGLAPDSEDSGEAEQAAPAAEPASDDLLAGLSALGAATGPALEQPQADAEAPTDWLAGLSSAQAEEEEETPDWLKSLTGQMEQQAAAEPGAEAAPAETGTPDWRAQLEAGEQAAAAPAPQAETEWKGFAAETDLPAAGLTEGAPESAESLDWLKDLEAQAEGWPESTPETGAAGEGTPDWLSSLGTGAESQVPASGETPGETPAPAGEEVPDWLKGIRAAETAGGAPAAEAEVPDWLGPMVAGTVAASLSSEAPAEEAGVGPAEESLEPEAGTPDWLKDLQPDAGAIQPPPPETPAAAEAEEETPDWLKAAAGATMVTIKPEEAETGTTQPLFAETPAAAEAEGETPDWLKAATAAGATMVTIKPEEAETGTTQPPFTETPAAAEAEGETPDWLKAATAAGATLVTIKPEEAETGTTQPPFTETPVAAEAEEDLPDWLKTAVAAGATVAVIKPEEAEPGAPQPPFAETPAAAEAEREIPDWLIAAAAAGATASILKPDESLPAAEQTPDWLSELGEGRSMAAGESEPGQEPLPDWLSETAEQASAGEPAATEPVEAVPAEAGEEGTPDWARATLVAGAAAAAALGGKPEPAAEELFPAAMPDWLADIQPAQEEGTPPPLPEGETIISEAELPSWVQAMRPVEAAAGEGPGAEEEQVVEKSGPLSGFSNVLPAAVGAAGARRVSAYPNKMLVNESQQSQIELLERLVADEGAAKPVGARERISSNRLLRWGIAALLLIFVMLPVILGTSLTPAVRLYPPELGATIKAVNALPADATVLVVVDYQPAFSGEMEAATTPLLDHLRLKGATVVFVSSSSTGSALADRLVVRVNSDLGGPSPEQYMNLGYLTGGASGITNFVANPVQAAPQTIAGAPAWGLPPLQGIDSLGDFAALVVLTDSSDTGAIWIEQSRTLLGRSPLLMAISAQAEPMLQPYYDSGQVQGMVTGLAGGVAYEQANGIPSIGSSYWDPFSVGFLVADIIIAVGGVMALLAAWQARRAQPVKEAQ